MAYELVNATQLDNDLRDIAEAIRGKSGGQSQLEFPNEFISEINGIIEAPAVTSITAKAGTAIGKNDIVQIYAQSFMACYGRFFTSGQGRNMCAFNPNGTRLAYALDVSPYIGIYDTSTVPFITISNPSQLPTGVARGCAWSPDGTRLAIAHSNSPYLTIYDTTTTPYIKLPNPGTLPAGTARGCAWSPDGTRLAVGHDGSPYLTIYDTTTTPYTKLPDPSTLPGNSAYGCAWSPDGTRLAIADYSSPYVIVYDTTTTPYTKLPDPSTLPAGHAYACAWSPDGTRLAIGFSSSPYLIIYDTSSVPFSKLADDPETIPTSVVNGLAWVSNRLYAATGASYLYVYDTTTAPYVDITPSIAPINGTVVGVAASSDAQFVAIAAKQAFGGGGYTEVVFVTSPTMFKSAKPSNMGNVLYGWSKGNYSKGSNAQAYKIISN